jgi:SAM-dependent methyltransferase
MHKNSEALFNKYALDLFEPNLKVLEIGPERQLYTKYNIDQHVGLNNYEYFYTDLFPDILKKIHSNHWGIAATVLDDAEMSHYVPMINENRIDSLDDQFDIVFATNVIEHVRMPWVWIAELVRVLKPGGKLILVCPGITTPYHEDPIDCWRIWPEGFNSLFTYAGLVDIRGTWEHVTPETDGYRHIDTIAIATKPINKV